MPVNWNELEFLSLKEFKRMIPSIIKLETTRIDKIIFLLEDNIEYRNYFVKAKYELNQFLEKLERAEEIPLGDSCKLHLENSILILSSEQKYLADNIEKLRKYVLNRLYSIYDRIDFIY